MFNSKLIGAIFLIAGACIGAGMLVLPATLAPLGLTGSIIVLITMWLFMCITGLLIIEVNLWLPHNTNYVSMTKHTLGTKGMACTWIAYTLLLYSLLAAYTTVGERLVGGIAQQYFGYHFTLWQNTTIWTGVFALIIYIGIGFSEHINRLLILGLIVAFSALATIAFPQITPSLLFSHGNSSYLWMVLPIAATSFGYNIVLPSIRDYLPQPKLLTWSVIIGTFIPLIVYIIWTCLLFGIIPIHGKLSFATIFQSANPSETLTQALAILTHHQLLDIIVRFFTFFAITTSLIPTALGLFDLMADGLQIEKDALGRLTLLLITFIPPYFYALLFPEGFVTILGYAAIFVVLLHGIIPMLMVWSGRYRYWHGTVQYKVWGGKLVLILILLFSAIIIFSELGYHFHWIPLWLI